MKLLILLPGTNLKFQHYFKLKFTMFITSEWTLVCKSVVLDALNRLSQEYYYIFQLSGGEERGVRTPPVHFNRRFGDLANAPITAYQGSKTTGATSAGNRRRFSDE